MNIENDFPEKKLTIWTRGFICVMIANVFANMAMFSVNTYATTYMSYLGVGTALAGFIAGLYYSVAFLLRPVSGPAVTLLNKKKLMICVYALGFFVNVGYALFPSVGVFVAMRTIHGIQLAFYGSLALTIASNSIPEEKMVSGLGIYGLTGILSQTLGPSLGVWVRGIGENISGPGGGFQTIFLTSALFNLIATIPCFLLPNQQEITQEEKASLGVWYKNIIAFEALIPSTVIALMSVAQILFSTYMIPYGEFKGITNIGIFFTINALCMLAVRPLAGKLTDKYGAQKTFYPAIIVYITAFVFISSAQNITFIVLGAICVSIGVGTIQPAVQTMAVQSVSPLKRGVASNTVFLCMDFGNFIGPTIAGAILSSADYVALYRFAIVPLLLAAVIFLFGWKPYLRQREKLLNKK